MILIRRPEMSFVNQARKRQSAWRARTWHMIRLRHEGRITGQDANEIILINAHEGASSDPLPWEAAFFGGKRFGAFRRRGGAPRCRIFTLAPMPPWPASGC